jgi:quercetin dioxygenase-like cupin family protein
MKIATMKITTTLVAITIVMLAAIGVSRGPRADEPQSHESPRENISPAFKTAIANVKGKTMTGVIVEYKPGGVTPPHRHGDAFIVAYVLSGSVRSKVDDGEVKTFREGESWTEDPGAHHRVSENASKTDPAKVLAIFIADDKYDVSLFLDKK